MNNIIISIFQDLFHIRQKFELDTSKKCYILVIDTDIPIQSIFFKCSFPLIIKKENHLNIIDNDEIGTLKINTNTNEVIIFNCYYIYLYFIKKY